MNKEDVELHHDDGLGIFKNRFFFSNFLEYQEVKQKGKRKLSLNCIKTVDLSIVVDTNLKTKNLNLIKSTIIETPFTSIKTRTIPLQKQKLY